MAGGAGNLDFAPIAPSYDKSRRAEPAIASALRQGLERLRAHRVLEVGSGTGNYAHELTSAGFELIALDPSAAMLALSRGKRAAARLQADALAIPIRRGAFDAAIAVNVFHHLLDHEKALRELYRVVRCGITLQAVLRENIETLWFRHYFPEIDSVLLPLHPTLGFMITAMLRAGFVHIDSTPIFYSGLSDLTFESARHRPELLFDPDFRAATSGFRRLSADAIQVGLTRLRRDMESGRLNTLIEQFELKHEKTGDCFVLTAFAG